MELERNALQMHVVPQMQQWCQERGWQFEIVDLRWGINEEASQAHRTMNICLEELDNCRRLSPKPHLLLLLGERYGWLPLPEQITQEEMQRLWATATEEEQMLTKQAYRLEGNLYPASYELVENVDGEEKLRDMMMRYCQESGDKDFYTRHLVSATEQEIQQGLLSHTEAFDQVVTYERTLKGLPQHLIGQYKDSEHNNELQILHQKVNEVVPKNNIIERVVDYTDYNSDEYVHWFAGEIKTRLQALVEEEMSAHNIGAYEEEQLNQEDVVEMAADNYQPRADEVERILHTLKKSEVGGICVVRGISGAGLTTLAAHICHQLMASGERLIYRFVGVGQMSSSGLLLLRTLLREVGETFNDNDSVFDLMAKWRIFLEDCTQRTFFVIDGLDRLEDDDWVKGLQWLPSTLSNNLHFLLTVNDNNLSTELQRYNVVDISLPQLEDYQFIDALIGDLHLRNRQLTSEQTEVIRKVYNNVKSPIVRRPLAALAARWSDKDSPSMDIPGLQELMDTYLEGLIVSNYHDRLFLGMALGLLCFCRHGVSEQELLEIIATDEQFFSHLHEHSHHRIITSGRPKVPFIYWSRLFHDIGVFLALRRNKSSITYVFANKTIKQCVEQWIDQQFPTMRHTMVELASNYFEQVGGCHSYEELPYLLENLGDEARQTKLIASNEFMLDKCSADMVDDLIADYNHYLKKHVKSSAREEVVRKRLFLQKNHQMITTYAKYGTDVVLSLWEQTMPDTPQGHLSRHPSGMAYTTIHIPGSIITAAANDDNMLVCHTPPSGISNRYMECFLIDRHTRENKAFALLPLGWNCRPPSNAFLSGNSKLAMLFSFGEESYVLWHTDTGVVKYQKKDELWDMIILPDNSIYYLTRTELRTIDDNVLCSFDTALGIDCNQERKICLDSFLNTLHIIVNGENKHLTYNFDTHESETIDNGDANIDYIIGYDIDSASLFYREDDDKSLYRYFLRENKTVRLALQPKDYIHAVTVVGGRWLAFIDTSRIACLDFDTNQTTLSDEVCDANKIQAFGLNNNFITFGCYELKEWEIAE